MTDENDKVEQAMQELAELSQKFEALMKVEEEHQEKYWNSLSKEQQLMVFCAVTRRIYDGEIIKKGTYRYVLYDVFGFGPEAYVQAQVAGYLQVHNAIFNGDEEDIIKNFAKFANINDEVVSEYFKKKYF